MYKEKTRTILNISMQAVSTKLERMHEMYVELVQKYIILIIISVKVIKKVLVFWYRDGLACGSCCLMKLNLN